MALFCLQKQSWSFPSNNYGQISGIADSGIETFNGTPIKSLAREICQNSMDAKYKSGEPVIVEFMPFEIPARSIPGFEDLKDAFFRAQNFWSLQKSSKAKKFFRSALEAAGRPVISCLRISDFNTTGLTGSDEEYNSPWCNLTKSTGASDKSGMNGGSFGIGKFAPYACSDFRTVFYSTADRDGICAYQGVARLTSFKNEKGEITQGTGFYGNDKNAPAAQQISLDPDFKRDDKISGTDIFILGFNGEKEWKHKIIASILDGFLYAVYHGDLIVNAAGIEVSRAALPKLMETCRPYFQEHADEYYLALTSDEKVSPTFVKEITEKGMKGKITLRLMIMPEMHRRVAMVRQTGMKIKDKGNINGLIPFAGLLYIEGDELNGFLRNLENPQHLEWEIERAENKAQARRLLSGFTRFIKEKLDELKNDDSEEALDPSVGEFLSAEQEEEKENQDTAEVITDTVRNIEFYQAPRSPKPSGIQKSDTHTAEAGAADGEIIEEDIPGKGGRNAENGGSCSRGDGAGGGDIPVEHRKSLAAVAPVKSRIKLVDKDNGKYHLVFVPAASAGKGVMDIYMSAETQNYTAKLIAAVCEDCPDIKIKNNRISGLVFTENVPLEITIQLDYHDYCPMEVKAYGNKI